MNNFIISAFGDEIDSSLSTQIKVLEYHNVKHLEIRGVNGKNITDYTLAEVKEIKNTLNVNNIRVSAIGSPIGKIGINDDFEPHLKMFLHTLNIAEIMETKYIRIFSFYIPRGEEPENYRAEVMKRMKVLVKYAEEKGIILLHENEKGIYGEVPERCLDILKGMKSKNIRATFDPANFVQCNVEVYPYAYDMLKEFVEYIHIKDALYENHEVVVAGEGDGNIYELLKRLKEEKFEGFLTLEPHLYSFEGFDKLEKSDMMFNKNYGDGAVRFSMAHGALMKVLNDIEI